MMITQKTIVRTGAAILLAFMLGWNTTVVRGESVRRARETAKLPALAAYENLPLVFESNKGQAKAEARYVSRTGGYALSIAPGEVVLGLSTTDLRLKWIGADRSAPIVAEQRLPGRSHYFLGRDPAQWHTGIAQYARVRYRDLYPGVDLTFYGNQRAVEFDFEIAPGADPDRIALGFEGARGMRIDSQSGDLILDTAAGEVRQHRPKAYQTAGGSRRTVQARYVPAAGNQVRIEVENYDRKRALVIDPVLSYSTVLWDGGLRRTRAVAVDAGGNVYLTGIAAPGDVFVTKLDPTGTRVLYNAYFGGRGDDSGNGIAVDRYGRAWIAGWTESGEFPTTPDAFQRGPASGRDAFTARLSADGSALEYSTYLGGRETDWCQAIALDPEGNAYVAGWTRSADFPVNGSSFQTASGGGWDAFVARLDLGSGALVYSTYLGGSGADFGRSIAVDKAENVYIAGDTTSSNFPTVSPLQAAKYGSQDVFVAKLSPEGKKLEYSTYLGGSGWEVAGGIAIDEAGGIYVAGTTLSTDYPVSDAAAQHTSGGSADAFVTKLASDGSRMIYSTYFGGAAAEQGRSIAVDGEGRVTVVGDTRSADLPEREALQRSFGLSERTAPSLLPSAWVGLRLDPADPEALYLQMETGLAKSTDGGKRWTKIEAGSAHEEAQVSLGKDDTALVPPDAFLMQLNEAATKVLRSSFLGGTGSDAALAAAVGRDGTAYVTGYTDDENDPLERRRNAFLAVVSPLELVAGTPKLAAKVLATTLQSPGVFSVYLQYTNMGDGDAQNVLIKTVMLRTQSGTGTATLATPVLPVVLGELTIGSSKNVLLTLNLPSTVTGFGVGESGTMQNAAATTLSFSLAQSIIATSPTNRNPTAGDDTATTSAGTAVNIAVLANDSDPDGDAPSVASFTRPANGSASFTNGVARYTPIAGFSGNDSFTYEVTDGKGGNATATVSVRVNRPPTLALTAMPSSGAAPLQVTLTATANDPEGDPLTIQWEFGDGSMSAGPASIVHTYQAAGAYTAKVTASDGLASAQATSVITAVPLPPDPVTVAPPLDATVAPSMVDATAFLYTGSNPIQTGVAPGTIEPQRAAVIRGKVLDRDGSALPAIHISILSHPEFGGTMSRADGRFDLAVNGGGILTVNYEKQGFLPSQRQIEVPWQDYVVLPDVVLIPLDAQVTAVDLTASDPIQVARGNVVSDGDGTRRATLLIPQGTQAEMVLADGSRQSLNTLRIRATEYTVGEVGPDAMPGSLPATSGYTYAVELSADEAIAAGAVDVRFSAPLPFYVENFLGFPVGINVPLGSYDRTRGAWVPAETGRVIKILGVTAGLADLDVNGDGLADGAAALAAHFITDAERERLATLYPSGQSLWRVRIPHFTPWDCNWPFGPPADAVAPDQDPEPEVPCESCPETGSIIEVQNQVLGEALGVVGTPFGLHYQSDRVPGRKSAYTLEIPVSGSHVPASLDHITVDIRVAGRSFRQPFGPAPNQRTTFTWDGKDAYGRTLNGPRGVSVRICYGYEPVYGEASKFGEGGRSELVTVNGRSWFYFCRGWSDRIGTWDARAADLGGWTLSAHHAYAPGVQKLYLGDGLLVQHLGATITTVAGNGSTTGDFGGDGGPATEARLAGPQGLALGPDGSLYIAESGFHRVRKVASDGTITTVAGSPTGAACFAGPCGDGGPATQTLPDGRSTLGFPYGVAVGPDGSLYISEAANRVRKVSPDGIITTIAGTGVAGFSGDGGAGRLAQLNQPLGLAFGPDNVVYIADRNNQRIRRVGPDGIITTVAGAGGLCEPSSAACGDGGLATLAKINGMTGVAVGPDGSIYITASQRVRRVTPDGIIRTIAGTGVSGFSGDGGLATEARFNNPSAVAVGFDETVYIVDQGNNRVRWFRPGGPIDTLAGTGSAGSSGDGGLAFHATLRLNASFGLAVGPDGAVYLSQGAQDQRVRRISTIGDHFAAGEIAIPALDGSEVYMFTPGGRHLRTVDGLTGALVHTFAYDGDGRLASVTDSDGNVTTVERDAGGNPTAIVGPFGQRTTLAVNADGFLSRITNPAGEAVQLGYALGGLLASFTNPAGHVSRYTHDPMGRLTSATDPTGATKTLARTGTNKDYTVTLTSSRSRATTYRVEGLHNGDLRMTATDQAGVQVQAVIGRNGRQTATLADGTQVDLLLGPDPRWGMSAPIAKSLTVRTPAGRVNTTTSARAVTLANAQDPFSLRTLTDTVTINGRVYTSVYDGVTRTLTNTSANGRTSTVVADDRGRLVQGQFGDLEPNSFAYDTRGRLSTITQGQGAVSRLSRLGYGVNGFLANITDPLDRTAALTTDDAGRLTQQTFPDGRQVRVAYDLNSNVIALAPPDRPDHNFGYTARDEVSSYTGPAIGAENSETRYTYDADRQPLRTDFPDGRLVGFQYDDAGRLSLIELVSGNLSYNYDAAGRLASVSTPAISLAYGYDGELPTSTIWSGAIAGSVTRTYDNDFRVTSLSVNGNPIAIEYDPDNLPIRVGDLSLTRNVQTGLITGTSLGPSADTWTYDSFGAPVGYTVNQGGAPVYSATYARDVLGRLTSTTETIGGDSRDLSYTYDLSGRLSEVRQNGALIASYNYDANGNRTSWTDASETIVATYDNQDRLIQYGSTAQTFNPNGELQSKTAGGQTTTYRYDGLGNLTGVTLPGGVEVEYLLDGQNRRIGKKVNGSLVQGFLYQDGLRPIVELNGSGTVVSRFVYATMGSPPDYVVKNGVTYRIITDHLGSPRLVLDVTTGEILQRMEYDEFGRVLVDTNPGFQPFGFAGGLYDHDTGLVHFGAREYDPDTGRWTTKDPIGFGGGDANLYGYVLTDPINNVDPDGLSSMSKVPFLHPMVRATLPGWAPAIERAAPPIQRAAQRFGQAISRGVRAVGNAIARLVCRTNTPQPPAASSTPTIQGIGRADHLGSRFADLERNFRQMLPHLGNFGSQGRWAQQYFRGVLGEFNALVFRLAGVYPGGPSVGLDQLERAYQTAVRIFGYDPTRYLP